MNEQKSIPIWFFIGLLLLVYGIICLGAGIAQFSNPPATVLSNLHASFWGGCVLLLIGGVYVWGFRPRR